MASFSLRSVTSSHGYNSHDFRPPLRPRALKPGYGPLADELAFEPGERARWAHILLTGEYRWPKTVARGPLSFSTQP